MTITYIHVSVTTKIDSKFTHQRNFYLFELHVDFAYPDLSHVGTLKTHTMMIILYFTCYNI